MVSFQTQNQNLGKFLRALYWKMLIFLWSFGIFYRHLGYFMAIWWCCGNLVYFPPFWYVVSRKIWQHCTTYILVGHIQWRRTNQEKEEKFHSFVGSAGIKVQFSFRVKCFFLLLLEAKDVLFDSEVDALWSDADIGRVARFFWCNIQKRWKIYQLTIKYTKWL
jgi:hypothetical protein